MSTQIDFLIRLGSLEQQQIEPVQGLDQVMVICSKFDNKLTGLGAVREARLPAKPRPSAESHSNEFPVRLIVTGRSPLEGQNPLQL
jgi:hypothetical protein